MSDRSPSSPPSEMLSPETLVDGPWFENVKRAYEVRTKPSHPPKWLVPVIGFSIAGLLWLIGWRKTAIVGGSIVALMTVLEFAAPAVAKKVQKGLAVFGAWAGQAIGWLLLCPMFLIVGPLSRVFTRVMGADPLGRRMANAPSYWHFGAEEKQRTKKTGSMFCVERRTASGKNWLGALTLLAVLGVIAAELVFRFWFGFHNPLLYMHDTDCGYRLRPWQDIRTGRGEVQVNNSVTYMPDEQRNAFLAENLANEKVVGLLQGKCEFGPRALGFRSILADARSPKMQSFLNLATKFRESFRPFAPICLKEYAHEFFEAIHDSPYMLMVDQVKASRCTKGTGDEHKLNMVEWVNRTRSDVPAVTHVDYSARIQTVDRDRNARLHDILTAFHARTGYPILVNTSFNVRSEPSSARPRMPTAASCAPASTFSSSKTTF